MAVGVQPYIYSACGMGFASRTSPSEFLLVYAGMVFSCSVIVSYTITSGIYVCKRASSAFFKKKTGERPRKDVSACCLRRFRA